VFFPVERTTEFAGRAFDVQAYRARVAYLPGIKLPYVQCETGLMEGAVDRWFCCRVKEHDSIVAATASVAVSIHLVEVALGE
jgi:hypothetical protein